MCLLTWGKQRSDTDAMFVFWPSILLRTKSHNSLLTNWELRSACKTKRLIEFESNTNCTNFQQHKNYRQTGTSESEKDFFMDCIGPRYHDWSPRDPQYNFNRLQSQKTQSEFVNLSGDNNQRHKNIYQISHLKFNEIFITATATAFMDARSRITTRQQCMITSLNSCSPWGIRKQWRPGQLRRALGRDWLKTGTALDWQRQRTWNLQRNNIISFTARIILMQYLQLLSLTITRYEHYSLATPVLFLYHIKGPLHWPWNGDSLSSHGWRTPKCPSPFGWKQRNKASRSLLFIELMSKLPHER